MNLTRWAFLYHGIQRMEALKLEAMQHSLARALGISVIPVRDPATGKMKMPVKLSEMQPLLLGIARPDYIQSVVKSMKDCESDLLGGVECDMPEAGDEEDFSNAPELPNVELGTDTGMEILDKPLNMALMTEAERRLVLQSIGVQVGEPAPVDQEVPANEPAKKEPARKGSFVLDD